MQSQPFVERLCRHLQLPAVDGRFPECEGASFTSSRKKTGSASRRPVAAHVRTERSTSVRADAISNAVPRSPTISNCSTSTSGDFPSTSRKRRFEHICAVDLRPHADEPAKRSRNFDRLLDPIDGRAASRRSAFPNRSPSGWRHHPPERHRLSSESFTDTQSRRIRRLEDRRLLERQIEARLRRLQEGRELRRIFVHARPRTSSSSCLSELRYASVPTFRANSVPCHSTPPPTGRRGRRSPGTGSHCRRSPASRLAGS